MSEKNVSIYESLINARRDFKPLKESAYNPFFKSRYADLKEVINSVKESLSANGLGFYQSADPISDTKEVIITTTDKNGTIKTETKIIGYSKITTTIFSVSGETITTTYPLIISDTADPQKVGSAVTYAKRYGLTAALGIASEDDDANSSVSRPAAQTASAKPTQQAKPATSAKPAETKPAQPVKSKTLEEIGNTEGVTVTEEDDKITVTGKTFSLSNDLRALGFHWDGQTKTWFKQKTQAVAA